MRVVIPLICIFFIGLIVSCVSYNQVVKCENNKEIIGNLGAFENGYSINLPEDWFAYNDIHCSLVYSPRENVIDAEMSKTTVVSIFGPKIFGSFKDVQNIDELTTKSIDLINKNFGNPEIFLTKLNHEKYGDYTVLRFKSNILGAQYENFSVNYCYNDFVYKISCLAKEGDFNKYSVDFQEIVSSFEILER
ncbi:MAG: hypothetical protein ACJA1B_001035 [Polaribacter sp.]|jgi:hypothetical protein